ncbi:MAG: topoisomerase DNA-binding C4 zinc finger domain-containing protein, partial [Oscillospiraceae bacterium]|nr:topoisomerase DNA-binding C4 zinc finger domain-containing protein [Oscillospiraceae bacterium]
SCSNFPSCKYTANLNKTPKEEPEKTGKICPECGGELLKRKNRYGNYFLGCSNYPKCHYLENIEGEKPRFVRRRKKNEG